MGLLDPLARVGAPSHLPDGRPRTAEVLAHHERVRLAHLPVDQRRRRALLGEVPLQGSPGRPEHRRRRGGGDHRHGRRPLPPRPVRGDRGRGLPGVGPLGPGYGLRRRGRLPVQPVRPDQGVAARGLPAHQGRPLHPQPQSRELLRGDRAGRVLAGEHGARDRHQPRQDADGAGVLLPRRSALPRGHQLQPDPRQRPARGRGAHLHPGRRPAPPLQAGVRACLRTELVRRPRGRRRVRRRGELGQRRRARASGRDAARGG